MTEEEIFLKRNKLRNSTNIVFGVAWFFFVAIAINFLIQIIDYFTWQYEWVGTDEQGNDIWFKYFDERIYNASSIMEFISFLLAILTCLICVITWKISSKNNKDIIPDFMANCSYYKLLNKVIKVLYIYSMIAIPFSILYVVIAETHYYTEYINEILWQFLYYFNRFIVWIPGSCIFYFFIGLLNLLKFDLKYLPHTNIKNLNDIKENDFCYEIGFKKYNEFIWKIRWSKNEIVLTCIYWFFVNLFFLILYPFIFDFDLTTLPNRRPRFYFWKFYGFNFGFTGIIATIFELIEGFRRRSYARRLDNLITSEIEDIVFEDETLDYIQKNIFDCEPTIWNGWIWKKLYRNLKNFLKVCRSYVFIGNSIIITEEETDFEKYFKILELEGDSDLESVKKAYKKLSKKYHPDVNKSADAEQKFKEIKEAYDILKNEYYEDKENENEEQ